MVSRTAVTAGLVLSLGACSGALPLKEQATEQVETAEQQQLESSLNVAAASADTGQVEAAKRLYTQLASHYPDAPEPRLGLAYLALRANDFTLAAKLFAEANERSSTPAARAEALLGAGRASLGNEDIAQAKTHFQAASEPAKGLPVEAWVMNGLGVVATLEGDHEQARQRYEEAAKLSSAHPMITANLVRALVLADAGSEARELYDQYPESYWLEGDGVALSLLLEKKEEAAREAVAAASEAAPEPSAVTAEPSSITAESLDVTAEPTGPGPEPTGVVVELSDARTEPSDAVAEPSGTEAHAAVAPAPPGATVQIYSARTERGALAAWGRLSSAEADLLAALTHRVVKAENPERGTFYRLWAGPLADKAAARHLCGQLKGRGRGCFVRVEQWNAGDGVDTAAGVRAGDRPSHEMDLTGVTVQLFSASTRAGALAAWGRLSTKEEDLLGALTPRVVRAQSPERGSFYRLWAGPLIDMTAAKHLCRQLRDRGQECFVRVEQWSPDVGVEAVAETGTGGQPGDGEKTASAAPAEPTPETLASETAAPETAASETPAPETAEAEVAASEETAAAAGAETSGAEAEPSEAAASDAPASDAGPQTPGATVQLYSARTERGAQAAWGRLSTEEKALLGTLTPRVVKAQRPKQGTVYRLWAGPLTDKAAAKRLCGQLKERGRQCFVRVEQWDPDGGTDAAADAAPGGQPGGAAETVSSPQPAAADEPAAATPASDKAAAKGAAAKGAEAEGAAAQEAAAAPAAGAESPATEASPPDAEAEPDAEVEYPRATVQLYAARTEDEALAAWGLLLAEEEDLLSTLNPRVVKTDSSEAGTFFRLWVGPLVDMAEARRLCDQLKDRGRQCSVRMEHWKVDPETGTGG